MVDGDRCVSLISDDIRVTINADHGAHIYELTDAATGIDLLYRDPRGSRDYVVGGWFELFPNAGAACTVGGRQLSRAGDIQHRRWHCRISSRTSSSAAVTFSTASQELPLHIAKTVRITAGVAGVDVAEVITNASRETVPYLWGQHLTFGRDFISAGTCIELPDVQVFSSPSVGGKSRLYADGGRGRLDALPAADGGVVDFSRLPGEPFTMMLFTEELPEHWYRIRSKDRALGATVSWDGTAFPYLWIWGTNEGTPRDPDIVALAVEPQSSNVPGLADAMAAGKASSLGPGASRSAWVRLRLHRE